MKSIRIAVVLSSVVLLAAACSKDKARIHGSIGAAEGNKIVLVSSGNTLDTLVLGAEGRFSHTLKIADGDPQFVDLMYGGKKIAALLLHAGDDVTVDADTVGSWRVAGSEECEKLFQVEKDYAQFLKEVQDISSSAVDEQTQKQVSQELSAKYIAYYRKCVKYILENNHSLTSVPVLFQKVSDGFPVFSQPTDAIHFRNLCDSLKLVYPCSRYVQVLDKEASIRQNALGLQTMIQSAEAMGFIDITLPNEKGQKIALSSVEAKAVLVHFWSAQEATHKMLNVDALKPLYDKFHPRGLEIYSICVDVDKATWATSVKSQNLPWVNVCDGLGSASPALRSYNVQNIPTTYLIIDGSLNAEPLTTESELRKKLDSVL